jgi:hypothetical protein
MEHRDWKWFHYYWNFCKQVGSETYKTWRWELCASAIIGFFIWVLTGNWRDFKTAILATAMTLGCFAIWHILRVPWLLHKAVVGETNAESSTLSGLLGLAVIVAIAGGLVVGGRTLWEIRPLGILQFVSKAPPPPIGKTRVITVQEPCKPEVGPSSPSPTAPTGAPQASRPPQPQTSGDAPTAYSELRDAITRANTVMDRWDRSYADWSVNLYRESDRDKRVFEENMIRLDEETLKDWANVKPYLEKAHSDAIQRMSLTPNQITRDQAEFDRALGEAGAQISFATDTKPDFEKFAALRKYLGRLITQLGDYR